MAIGNNHFQKNVDYTLAIELMALDYNVWHKTQIIIEKHSPAAGETIHSCISQKFSHRFINSTGNKQFMYYHTTIIQFQKDDVITSSFVYFTVNMDQIGADLGLYPNRFIANIFLVACGIVGKVHDINTDDRVYHYHKAFDIESTKMKMNVPLDMNGQKILNFNHSHVDNFIINCKRS